jgi:hypothetical protein
MADLALADPGRAVERAMRAASRALAEGRALEAQALIKAAEGLTRLTGQVGPIPLPEPAWMAALRRGTGLPQDEEACEVFIDQVWATAGTLALDMLSKAPDTPRLHARAVYGWRAKRLGPEVAARDHARAKSAGCTEGVFDFNGRVLPLPSKGGELMRWLTESLTRNAAERGESGAAPPSSDALGDATET